MIFNKWLVDKSDKNADELYFILNNNSKINKFIYFYIGNPSEGAVPFTISPEYGDPFLDILGDGPHLATKKEIQKGYDWNKNFNNIYLKRTIIKIFERKI